MLKDLHRAASLAQAAEITVSLKDHSGTLTDATDSTLDLLKELNHPNLFTYWSQPPISQTPRLSPNCTRFFRGSAHCMFFIGRPTAPIGLCWLRASISGAGIWRPCRATSDVPLSWSSSKDDFSVHRPFLQDAQTLKDLIASLP